jgi:hypothetical protein
MACTNLYREKRPGAFVVHERREIGKGPNEPFATNVSANDIENRWRKKEYTQSMFETQT